MARKKKTPLSTGEETLARIRIKNRPSNPDADMLRKKGIKSPDLSSMPFRVNEGKTIRFFKTEEKYLKFMKRRVV
nr:hypothetical protein [uncultured Draconibacterium sp.]